MPDLKPTPDTKPVVDSDPAVCLSISEVMVNPVAIGDGDGEWIELHNACSQGVDLGGWSIEDYGSDWHVIQPRGPLVIPPGGYLVLGRSADISANGGVTVDYVYSNLFHSNYEDEVVLIDPAGDAVDELTYAPYGAIQAPEGASLSRKLSGSGKGGWCIETKSWPGSAGDKGTPGAPPGC